MHSACYKKGLALFIAGVSGLLASCGDQVDGGEQTAVNLITPITGVTRKVNNRSGAEGEGVDGVSQPYLSLQQALDDLRPGDVLIIEETELDYSNTDESIGVELDASGNVSRELFGFNVSRSGTEDLPIIIEGEGFDDSSRPAIDQGQSSSTNGHAMLGLYLDCVSHVVIRNIEIRNVSEAGISSSMDGACQSSRNITIENNHIHNVYGEKYVGGIRMMGVNQLTISENIIHDVSSDQVAEDKNLLKDGRGLTDILIENNRIESTPVGVSINAQGIANSEFEIGSGEAVIGLRIKGNQFESISDTAISLQQTISDVSDTDEQSIGYFIGVDIYSNEFTQVGTSTVVETGRGSFSSDGLCFFNNSISETANPALDVSGLTGLEVFNTIFDAPDSEILISRSPENIDIENKLAYSDFNAFGNFSSLSWRLGANTDGSAGTPFTSLPTWQTAVHPELVPPATTENPTPAPVEPDLNSIENDPMPDKLSGRYGVSLGASASLPVDSIQMPCFGSL